MKTAKRDPFSTSVQVANLKDVVVSILPEAIAVRDELAAKLQEWLTFEITEENLPDAVELVQASKKALTSVENGRKAIKSPVLEIGRQVDDQAKAFREPIERLLETLTRQIGEAEAARRRRLAEEEAKRRRELEEAEARRKKAEEDRKRAEDEEARRQEAERQAAEAAFLGALEPGDTPAGDQSSSEGDSEAFGADVQKDGIVRSDGQGEASRDWAASLDYGEAPPRQDPEELKRQEAEAKAEEIRLRSQVAVAKKAGRDKGGVAIKKVWKFEVQDIDEVYKYRPDLVELTLKRGEVLKELGRGVQIFGIEAWQEEEASIR